MNSHWIAVFVSCLVISCGGSDPVPVGNGQAGEAGKSEESGEPEELCVAGLIQTCACEDGRVSTKTCGEDNRFGPCSCELEPQCVPNLIELCDCASGPKTGTKICGSDGKFGNCECPQGAGGSAGSASDSGASGGSAGQGGSVVEQDAGVDVPQIEQDAGVDVLVEVGQDAPVDPCQSKQCPLVTHCVANGVEAECIVDDSPMAIDCPLPGLVPDPKTDSILVQSRFLLPDDAVPNNNWSIGPFCCTGHTAILKNSANAELGYAYFYSWEGQAVIVGETSYVGDVTILVAGLLGVEYQIMVQNAIHLTADELASCTSHWVHAGGFMIKIMPMHADLWRTPCLGNELSYDMGTLKLAMDVRYDGP